MKQISLALLCMPLFLFGFSQHPTCMKLLPPVFSNDTKIVYEQKLAEARALYNKDSTKADHIIWYGRRLGYLGKYDEAISIFSRGIAIHPGDARLYRHRGHRYITVRCFDNAINDLEKAARLIRRSPDEVEPDGIPNAKNIPTSTLQSNIWYHLGLAYYLKRDFKKAAKAYNQCIKVSTNNDMYVATANWYYITLRRLGKKEKAAQLLATVDPAKELIENMDYLKILLLYKQEVDFTNPLLLLKDDNTLSSSTFGYGLALYILLTEGSGTNTRRFESVLEKVLKGNQVASFGFIAAETEYARLFHRHN